MFSYNDIAILEFPEYVDFGIEPVKLAKNYVDNYNDTAIAAGYGRYKFKRKFLKHLYYFLSIIYYSKFIESVI